MSCSAETVSRMKSKLPGWFCISSALRGGGGGGAEEVEIGVDVVLGGDGVEDEVEAAGVFLHLVGVAGDDDVVGSESKRVFFLVGRGGEDDDVGSERAGELHAHVAQPAQ